MDPIHILNGVALESAVSLSVGCVCPDIYGPVCALNGDELQDYGNSCAAECEYVKSSCYRVCVCMIVRAAASTRVLVTLYFRFHIFCLHLFASN